VHLPMRHPRLADDSGAYAVIFAILMVVFVGLAAVVIDLGLLQVNRREAQTAADLSALAAGQDIPQSTLTAAATAATYLQDNGFPSVVASDLTDGNVANGEMYCYLPGDDVQGPGQACTSTMHPTALRVITPNRNVPFAFFPILTSLLGQSGSTSGTTDAAATVEVRSLGNILPYLLPGPTDSGDGCVKDAPKGSDKSATCTDPSAGNFGFADIPRTDGYANKPLLGNIKLGVQFAPAIIENPTVVAQGLNGTTYECAGLNDPESGMIPLDAKSPASGYTCLPSRTGNIASVATNALIQDKSPCDGRLATKTATGFMIGGCNIVPDQFSTYAPDGATGTGNISPDILSDPRFGIVPLIASPTLPTQGSSNSYAVVGFLGVYYKDFLDNKGKTVVNDGSKNPQITEITTYLFDLGRLPSIMSNDGKTIDFTGAGPRIPVLVK
jgi:Flp pilus assembly protein TadG